MNDIEKINLWAEYQHSGDPQLREKIILEYASLVKIVAGRLNMYLGYAVEYDDLVGYGIFGLIDAIDKFDSSKEVKFETYASLRIRGAILDQIRKMEWIPRSLRQKQRKIDAAITKLESQFGRNATDEEIAKELLIDILTLYNAKENYETDDVVFAQTNVAVEELAVQGKALLESYCKAADDMIEDLSKIPYYKEM